MTWHDSGYTCSSDVLFCLLNQSPHLQEPLLFLLSSFCIIICVSFLLSVVLYVRLHGLCFWQHFWQHFWHKLPKVLDPHTQVDAMVTALLVSALQSACELIPSPTLVQFVDFSLLSFWQKPTCYRTMTWAGSDVERLGQSWFSRLFLFLSFSLSFFPRACWKYCDESKCGV